MKYPAFILGALLFLVIGGWAYHTNLHDQELIRLRHAADLASPSPSIPTADPEADWQTYTDPTFHLTFRYPPTYQLEPPGAVTALATDGLTLRLKSTPTGLGDGAIILRLDPPPLSATPPNSLLETEALASCQASGPQGRLACPAIQKREALSNTDATLSGEKLLLVLVETHFHPGQADTTVNSTAGPVYGYDVSSVLTGHHTLLITPALDGSTDQTTLDRLAHSITFQ